MLDTYGEIGSKRVNNPREDWQIDALNDKECLQKYLENFDEKVSIRELAKLLDSSESLVGQKINKYGLQDFVDNSGKSSICERELQQFVNSLCDDKEILKIVPLEYLA